MQLGFVFCRRFWDFITQFKPEWSPDTRRRIPSHLLADLQWWNSLFPLFNGVRFFDDKSRCIIHLFTDASSERLGAFFFDHVQSESCRWEDQVKALPREHSLSEAFIPTEPAPAILDINVNEITATLAAFKRWAPSWRTKRIIVHTDNTTTLTGIRKQTLKSPEQNSPLRELLLLGAQYDIRIDAVHIPGVENGLADALSRNFFDKIADWCPHWQTDTSPSMRRQEYSSSLIPRPSSALAFSTCRRWHRSSYTMAYLHVHETPTSRTSAPTSTFAIRESLHHILQRRSH